VSDSDLRVDPIEQDPRYQAVVDEAERLAWAELATKGIHEGFGVCHVFWPTKKRILRKRFGIRWKTPEELNRASFSIRSLSRALGLVPWRRQ